MIPHGWVSPFTPSPPRVFSWWLFSCLFAWLSRNRSRAIPAALTPTNPTSADAPARFRQFHRSWCTGELRKRYPLFLVTLMDLGVFGQFSASSLASFPTALRAHRVPDCAISVRDSRARLVPRLAPRSCLCFNNAIFVICGNADKHQKNSIQYTNIIYILLQIEIC